MPGLSQLKKFSSDLLSLGDETNLRAARGEKPVKVEIPKEIEDKNDSEEFVLGMPVIEAETEVSSADEDLSDLTALVNPAAASNDKKGEAEPAPSFEAPDMSALLNPVAPPADDDAGMPDLSMFDEPEEEPEEVVEEEPEEVSIADMGLDALLAGGGFDEPEEEPAEEDAEESDTEVDLDDFEDITDLDDIASPAKDEAPVAEAETLEEPEALDEVESLEEPVSLDEPEALDDAAPLDEAGALDDIASFDEPAAIDDVAPLDDAAPFDEPEALDDVAPLDEAESLDDAAPLEEPAALDDLASFDEPAPAEDAASFDEPAATDGLGDLGDLGDLGGLDDLAPLDEAAPVADAEADTFETPEVSEAAEAAEETDSLDNSGTDELADLGSLDLDGMDFDTAGMDAASAETPASETPAEDSFDTSGMDDMESFGIEPVGDDASSDAAPASDSADEDAGGIPEGLFDAGDFDLGGGEDGGEGAPAPEFSAEDEIPDFDDTAGLDDLSADGASEGDENAPLEVFDTSEMEGMDFGIQDTDSQISGGGNGDFEFGTHEDFAMEGEFEIPGFSDVATAKEEKSKTKLVTGKEPKVKKARGRGKSKDIDEADFSDAQESEELPPNTLSDEQYKVFLENLAEYPLNVRLAFEDFIVQDEFTDDAEFEIIEKILNKAPARQVAGMLEKMLDTSIPIPRDFEHRTAAEYEAYKKSLSYQLRNKIIPGILLGLLLLIVGWGLAKFTNYCIIKPIWANSLYKQGYALLEADEYPQAENKFEEAAKKRINKKWFFRYARGYRAHKQYQRAGKMYQNILRYFKHDKAAGLEYADMELNDLANYERAEEIVRREVLDYHINDADGILMLGDVFLEWGTEKDPSKLEQAREQYANLIQLYKPTDLYMSRMMRYFIRTDNLREVIQMQKNFEKREKSLSSDDWAELSGYLLDKYYGNLAPSEEYLRYEIEGLRGLLLRAVKTNPDNPIALYNLAKYFLKTNETAAIESTLQTAIEKFNTVPSMKKRDLYKYIDSYRLLGEHYIGTNDYLQAQEQFAEGISLFTIERDNAGFEGTPAIGKLYEDMGNIKYTISGDYDDALFNYKYSVELENDNPSIRYRIGYIQYKKKNYMEALGAFMKSGDGNIKERNLMLAMANTLYLRGDEYAAQGYYDQLIDELDAQVAESGLVLPQANVKDYDLINTYLYASNNYGVTLYKLAKRTGNSALNAQAIVQLSQSVRAWDALTRNQETMKRLEGGNLAEQNIKYITHPIPEFEPSIYTDISKTLLDNERL
jgi:tetratricopeptide (TPR) repeat protein